MSFLHLNQVLAGLALFAVLHVAQAASAVHKCLIDGTVTFQSGPCPTGQPARRPTLDELNAERKKRLAVAAAQAASAAPARAAPAAEGSRTTPLQGSNVPNAPNAPNAAASDLMFRCDGRQYCSQMRSCHEAKYFLANCPGAKMDGDGDGVPCEQQWCTHPLAK